MFMCQLWVLYLISSFVLWLTALSAMCLSRLPNTTRDDSNIVPGRDELGRCRASLCCAIFHSLTNLGQQVLCPTVCGPHQALSDHSTYTLSHSLTHPPTHSPTHSLTHPPTHPPTHYVSIANVSGLAQFRTCQHIDVIMLTSTLWHCSQLDKYMMTFANSTSCV